jgi:hypothetical protein
MDVLSVQMRTLQFMLKFPKQGLNQVSLLAVRSSTQEDACQTVLPPQLLDRVFKGWAVLGRSGLAQHEALTRVKSPRPKQTLRKVLPPVAIREATNIVVLFAYGRGAPVGTHGKVRTQAAAAIKNLSKSLPRTVTLHNTAVWLYAWGPLVDLVVFRNVLYVNRVPVPTPDHCEE